MPETIKAAIERMERLEVALLLAEKELKEFNTKAQIRLQGMRDEITALRPEPEPKARQRQVTAPGNLLIIGIESQSQPA